MVGLDVVHDPLRGTAAGRAPTYLVVAAGAVPPAVAVLRFDPRAAGVLWRAAAGDGDPLCGLFALDAIRLRPGATAPSAGSRGDAAGGRLQFWLGGASAAGEATLVDCLVHWDSDDEERSEDNDSNEDDGSWWWDTSDDEEADEDAAVRSRHQSTATSVGFGSIFSLDWSPALDRLAAAIGTDVKVLGPAGGAFDEAEIARPLCVLATLATDHMLYCVKIHAPGRLLAAGGAGEAVFVWSLATGTLRHILRRDELRQCHLATRCIMACTWITGADSETKEKQKGEQEGESHLSIIAGGYDGTVTQWLIGTWSNADVIE